MAIQGSQWLKLGSGVVGATGYTITVQWPTAGIALSGTTGLTGTKRSLTTGTTTVLNGTLLATGTSEFTWKFGSNDVLTADNYVVQFTAAFVLGNIVSAPSKWLVHASL